MTALVPRCAGCNRELRKQGWMCTPCSKEEDRGA